MTTCLVLLAYAETKMRFLALITVFLCLSHGLAQTATASLESTFASIRDKHKLPALAGAIFTSDGLMEEVAVGVRKRGAEIPVTLADKWHLGSDTKAMTAMLVGTFVSEGRLSWDSKVISFFPNLADRVPTSIRNITIGQVLAHQAGMKDDMDWFALAKTGTIQQQRTTAVMEALQAPAYPPGTFHYANVDYVIAGAILEKVSQKPWEELMNERLFQPLKMESAGFGRAASPDHLDQPWPHFVNGDPIPDSGHLARQPQIPGWAELPHVLGPAGLVHCNMADWAKFLSDQLRGASGQSALLPVAVYRTMQNSHANAPDGYGWGIVEKDWAGGKTLVHEGSDGMNFCVCWLAPLKKFGVLVCTNQGGDDAEKACDEGAGTLILRYQSETAQKQGH